MTAEEREPTVCAAHERLMEEIVGMRADFRWFLRIGTGIFGLCGLVTTLITPTVIGINAKIVDVQKEMLIVQRDILVLKEQEKRIIQQRNYDHNTVAPLQ